MALAAAARDRSYIRASSLSGFAAFIESRNGDPTALLERAGIDPRAPGAPDMLISFARQGALLENAARDLGIPALGLEWALAIPPHFPNAGPTLLLKETTATFGEWVERSMRYWRLQTNAVIPQLVQDRDAGVVAIRLSPQWPQPAPRQQMEHILGKIVRLARAALADGAWNPVRVRFRHEAPEETATHDLLFRCPVEFAAGQDEIVLLAGTLARPLGGQANVLEALADEFLRHRIGLLQRYVPCVSTSTALAIRTVLGAGLCSKEFIALALGSSPRKLQRLLAREGTTYEDILDSVRKDMACQLLADATAPIAAIAGMLDFASPAALTLAVRRWTGMTPSGYRQVMGPAAEAGSAA